MCGITAIISGIDILDQDNIKYGDIKPIKQDNESNTTGAKESLQDVVCDLKTRLLNRGPDSIVLHEKKIQCTNGTDNSKVDVEINLISSVLGMRGELTVQPLIDKQGNILMWNGELFDGYEIGQHDNDTMLMSHLLSTITNNPRDVLDIMVKVKGPYAFIYWHESCRRLWFGRDVLGRRSLLVNRTQDRFILSSIGSFPNGIDDSKLPLPQWNEINTFGLYSIDFPEIIQSKQVKLQSHSWDIEAELNLGITAIGFDNADDDDNDNQVDDDNSNETSTTTTTKDDIDQFHFYPFGKRTQLTIEQYSELTFDSYVDGLYNAISKSIYTRICNLPNVSNTTPKLIRPPFHQIEPTPLVGRLGVLFSGGLDSMVLAAMSDKHLEANEPIHLINVAFGVDPSVEDYDKVTDRKAAIAGYYELKAAAPNRDWKLIKVNVTEQEMEWAKRLVYELMYPAITIMDMTICLALWFASRGEGILHDDETKTRYMTTCKVLLMGSGADEQMAGYGRHRSAYARGSWPVLQGELNKDFNRIWKRNLGRDDRVLSSSRREPRFPYLDENVIEYLNNVPLPYVCDLSLPQGTGDKRILRQVGVRLKLTESTKLIKRAIQFGSKSSKQLNKNIPARITQKCGKETFSFTTPLYVPENDPSLAQSLKTKAHKVHLSARQKRLSKQREQQQQQEKVEDENIK
ncbi:hypothetical protein CYY_004128 [Polysphondylium violaceum]|uniref:Glutamine amidotransferase type-2 domain-containing protein n=1 Tax=Polysphondylium violaceum TaxID=133409 RepID=A0A8J4PVQ2_9MYCE|nr:hypothetical protein CYY_004128 [Polysphondylium violaceum]